MTTETKASKIFVEVGPGELIDKLTILAIKSERIADPDKLKNIQHELTILQAAKTEHIAATAEIDQLEAQLKHVNETLWQIEDDIRQCEADKDFGDTFIQLARSVYLENDKRAKLKKDINLLVGSTIIEEKSYTEFS